MAREVLSEKTLLPLSLVLVLVGAIFWVSTFYSQSIAQGKEIEAIQVQQLKYAEDLSALKADISFIRGILQREYGH